VPSGSTVDVTDAVERQIERFAPGFRDTIISRHRDLPADIESRNPNNVGGDIGGGVTDLRQLFTRPRVSLRPWRTGAPGLYLCSSSTPPGAGVHGMCGLHAANLALAGELR
jgi:phytoene dehydrogenase-like protein